MSPVEVSRAGDMVICFEWHRTAVDPKSSSAGLPMTGEDTGLGALASPLVGYLGKVQERAALLENCPWCTAKGSTYALRSYRINLQDSITLCTNPQCLFPLVSRSLEDVLASLEPVQPAVGSKRKDAPTQDEEEPMKPSHKRRRSGEVEPQAEQGAADVSGHSQQTGGRLNGCMETLQVGDKVLEQEVEGGAAPEVEDERRLCSLDVYSAGIDSPSRQTAEKSESESETAGLPSAVQPEELVPAPARLFWRNRDKLCWLDSLLVAVVNCRGLTARKPEQEPQRSAVWRLIGGYEDACAAVRVRQQVGRDGVVRVPLRVLQKADADLQALRMSVFELLQPKLQCKLGQRETPVFALPLLLQSDSWAEPLCQAAFHWEFSCSRCSTFSTQREIKTLPTFTNVLAGWRPLDAVHSAPCNVCRHTDQRRTMRLESVPEVFGLHFVDGLPDSDLRSFSFSFRGKRHSVSAVIQYDHKLKHFVTWISNPDGSWLEFDDLKHPDCATHQRLPVPAQEMHVVFWEASEDEASRSCSPSSTFSESLLSKVDTKPGEESTLTEERQDESPDDTADILSALTDAGDALEETLAAGGDTPIGDTSIGDTSIGDMSIGSTTLLDTFEGLSHNDIITLTLVELNPETLQDDKPTEAFTVPSGADMLAPAPDSSSAVTGSESAPDVELPAASPADDSSSDPTFVPAARGGRRRGRGAGRSVQPPRRQSLRRAAAAKAQPAPPVPSETATEIEPAPAAAVIQEDTPPVETPRQASPESTTSQTSPTEPPQSARWSFLLSKHPLNQVNRSIAKVAAAMPSAVKVVPRCPANSTPNPVRKPHAPGGFFPKPQLRTEESEGLPPKAAEMYGGFGAKTPKTVTPLPPPARLTGKPTVGTPDLQKPVRNSTPASGMALSTAPPPEITSLKKHSKLPAGLSDTDVLRYKLIKKLKAKKKKLAKLNEMLGHQGGAGSLRPDSTRLGSPGTVTSSTYDGSVSDDLLSDLLSPATTASNLSPDSTGFLEMLASRQDGGEQMECTAPNNENFLEEFLSQAVAQRPTDMETEALSALELFM